MPHFIFYVYFVSTEPLAFRGFIIEGRLLFPLLKKPND